MNQLAQMPLEFAEATICASLGEARLVTLLR